ncbi:MAG: DUF2147 domain-containing protein [Tidjanibacter sp.]|nr:DUF2147 domain-containing protein [Tidjanibacter sp.]
MKRVVLFFAMVLLGTRLLSAQSCDAPNICGTWLGQEKTNKVEIYRTGNLWEGKAVWNSEYGDVSGQNIMVLRNLSYDADDHEWKGKIYDPFHDKVFNVVVSLQKNGRLKVVGKAGIISKTMIWTRIPAPKES